ncbi:MAG: hypothetical protein U5J64_08915 [Halobacteriales archaeon]|nr:hypothetical protein [Halobacteriales archaeon]
MSTETVLPDSETVDSESLVGVFSILLGSFVVFIGTFVLFAASPEIPADPVFVVSPVEPVEVIANMAVGTSIITAGALMAITKLEEVF